MQLTIPIRTATIDTEKYVLMDNPAQKLAFVNFLPAPLRLVLWQGAEYDAAGDYTQAQVDARISELLGSDPAATLSKLVASRS